MFKKEEQSANIKNILSEEKLNSTLLKRALEEQRECDYCDDRSLHNHITEQMLISIANSLLDIKDSLKELNKRREI